MGDVPRVPPPVGLTGQLRWYPRRAAQVVGVILAPPLMVEFSAERVHRDAS
jgi:hypothetical protein